MNNYLIKGDIWKTGHMLCSYISIAFTSRSLEAIEMRKYSLAGNYVNNSLIKREIYEQWTHHMCDTFIWTENVVI